MSKPRSTIRGTGCLAVLLLCLLGPLAGDSQAATPVASFASPACPTDVATWHIAYRLYWTSSLGQTTSRSALPSALRRAAEFAADVSEDSACGVRAVVDVFDEGAAVWPASKNSEGSPADTQAFLAGGGYDWIFYRFPSNGESYCAVTDPTGFPAPGTSPSQSRFPVDPEGRLGCEAGSRFDCTCEPSDVLMEHEWLHAVVAFYNPRLGWPRPDVHGACAHGFPGSRCPGEGVNEGYFAAMMQGLVQEADGPKGIEPDEWTRQGTPAHPLIAHPRLRVRALRRARMSLSFPRRLGGPVRLTVKTRQDRTVRSQLVRTRKLVFSIPKPGRWLVCLDFEGSEAYYRAHPCSEWSFYRSDFAHRGRSRSGRLRAWRGSGSWGPNSLQPPRSPQITETQSIFSASSMTIPSGPRT